MQSKAHFKLTSLSLTKKGGWRFPNQTLLTGKWKELEKDYHFIFRKQNWLVMKLTAILLLATCLQVSATGFSQNVTLSEKNVPLQKVFKQIHRQTGFQFFYQDEMLDNAGRVSINVENAPLEKVLSICFKDVPLSYSIVNNTITVMPKKAEVDEHSGTPVVNMIHGTVKNAQGNPLVGVSVIVKGTTKGTSTGADGAFNIDANAGDLLEFTMVGYQKKSVKVGKETEINVTLKEEAKGLNDVVVIGYGAVKKKDLTGAVGSVNSDVITATNIPDATGALQGRVAGLNIEQNAGKPGGSYDITIRGLSSINNSNTPLYVIDGTPTTSGLNDLNPQDIEKIDVLKDASATAIYGSRGANGVIIVTTKKGTAGKTMISYDGYYGYRTPANMPDMMNGPQYVQWRTDLFNYQGKSTDRSNAEFFTPDEWKMIDSGNYYDWMDLFRNGIQNSNTITASGGDSKGTFALSIGQLKEEGTVPGQDFNRYTMHLNLDRKFGDKWKAGGNLYFSNSVQNEGSYNTIVSLTRMPPVAYPYDSTGKPKYRSYRQDYVPNPMFEYGKDGEQTEHRRYRAFGNIYLQFQPVKDLTLRSQLSPQMIFSRDGSFIGLWAKDAQGNPAKTSASYNTTDYFGYVLDNQLNYNKNIGKHNLDLSAIQSVQYEQWEYSNQSAKNFPFNSQWYNLGAVTLSDVTASGTNYQQATLSSFTGRLNYSYNDKYLFTATGRYDGSSRLAPGNKWAFFPSAAFAWRISEEDFLKNSSKINNLKLRLTYGVTGNDAVSIYETQANVSSQNYDYNGVLASGYYKSGLANTDLTWEKTMEINLGVDYGFFKNRINGSIDIYRRDAKDLIMRRQLPQTSGWTSIWDNIGWVRNTGIELGLNTLDIQTTSFMWSTNIIFSTNKNQIVELYGGKKDDVGNGWFIGKPIQVNYDYQLDGIWQLSDSTEAAKYGQTPGQIRVKDLNNDGKIDANDRTIIGQRTPKWSGSITNSLKFKNWDFSVYVYTRQGEQLFSTFVATFMGLDGNYDNVNVNYWTPNNPSNKAPEPGNKGKYFNNYRYQDVSFVRVGNISLGYSIPNRILNRLKMNKLRIYGSVTNPFTFTSYPGFDPEWADQNVWGDATGYSTYLLGINLQF